MTGATSTCGAGTSYPFRVHESTLVFCEARVAQSLVFYVVFCRSLSFVLLILVIGWIVCLSSVYSFRLPLWYLQTFHLFNIVCLCFYFCITKWLPFGRIPKKSHWMFQDYISSQNNGRKANLNLHWHMNKTTICKTTQNKWKGFRSFRPQVDSAQVVPAPFEIKYFWTRITQVFIIQTLEFVVCNQEINVLVK